jgi:hypothetical protein
MNISSINRVKLQCIEHKWSKSKTSNTKVVKHEVIHYMVKFERKLYVQTWDMYFHNWLCT